MKFPKHLQKIIQTRRSEVKIFKFECSDNTLDPFLIAPLYVFFENLENRENPNWFANLANPVLRDQNWKFSSARKPQVCMRGDSPAFASRESARMLWQCFSKKNPISPSTEAGALLCASASISPVCYVCEAFVLNGFCVLHTRCALLPVSLNFEKFSKRILFSSETGHRDW